MSILLRLFGYGDSDDDDDDDEGKRRSMTVYLKEHNFLNCSDIPSSMKSSMKIEILHGKFERMFVHSSPINKKHICERML